MLREGKKRVFDMGKVSGSFQDYIPTGAGDIEQNSQKAVSTARKHQADSLILYIPPPLWGGDIIMPLYYVATVLKNGSSYASYIFLTKNKKF